MIILQIPSSTLDKLNYYYYFVFSSNNNSRSSDSINNKKKKIIWTRTINNFNHTQKLHPIINVSVSLEHKFSKHVPKMFILVRLVYLIKLLLFI